LVTGRDGNDASDAVANDTDLDFYAGATEYPVTDANNTKTRQVAEPTADSRASNSQNIRLH
jgi:hypothetical protein